MEALIFESRPTLKNPVLLLSFAGWSDAARRDAEVYRLVDCDGLTPLLALFSEATLAKGAESIALARAEHQALEGQLPLRLEDRR